MVTIGLKGEEIRTSMRVSHGNFSFGINEFKTSKTTQNNWVAGWDDGEFSVYHENDIEYGDSYRTAAVELGYNNGHGTRFNIGMKLYTGFTDKDVTRNNEYARSKLEYAGESQNYLAGILYGGVRYRGQSLQLG